MSGPWTAELYEDRPGHYPIEAWLDGLTDQQSAALRAAVSHVLEPGGLALASTAWLKPLKEGLYEFRVRHSAHDIVSMYVSAGQVPPATPEKILLRVFVHFHGQRVILLLHGYGKGADDSPRRQQREIAVARKRLGAWKRAEAARSRRRR